MHTLRPFLAGPVILTLLLGLVAPAAAQSPAPSVSPVPTSATGTLAFAEPASDGASTAPGDAVHVHTWTSTDPRLTGTATYTGSWQLYDPPAEDCDAPDTEPAAVYEIVNEGGGWRCAGFRAPVNGPDGASNVHTIVLRGTGGYEGLTVYMLVDWSASPYAFSALITPNKLPAVPVLPG
jgi:hypothetical protein